MHKKIETIRQTIELINSHKNSYSELIVESINGYGFNEIEESLATGISEDEVDGCIVSLMHICDVIDEEAVMPVEFYELTDKIESYLTK